MAEVTPAEIRRAAREAEWGTYVAIGVISIGGVRAFNPGDPVPVSHVTSGVVSEDEVERRQVDQPSEAADPDGDAPARPADAANLKAWANYALAVGKTQDELEGLNREQIRTLIDTPVSPGHSDQENR
jgi:hypothetical protein